MSAVKKQLYDVALDGQGYVLSGDPIRAAIKMSRQPVFGNRFAQGDRDLQDLSFWWFIAQRDFTEGIKELNIFADDAKYFYGRDLDSYSVPGEVSQSPVQSTIAEDFTGLAINSGDFAIVGGTAQILQGVQGATAGDESKIYRSTDGAAFTDVTDAAVPDDGVSYKHIKYIGLFDEFLIARNDATWGFSSYDGTTHTDRTAAVQGADSMTVADGFAEAGGRAWAFFRDGGSPAALIMKSSVAIGTWTKRKTIAGAFFQGGVDLGGNLVYVIDYGGNVVELHQYDVSTDTDVTVWRWVGKSITLGTARNVRGGAINTIDGRVGYIIFDDGEIWKYDGSEVSRAFRNTASQIPANAIGYGLVSHLGRLHGPGIVIESEDRFHPGPYRGNAGDNRTWPIFSAKFTGDTTAVLYSRDDTNSTSRKRLMKQDSGAEALLELNNVDGNVPNIDKLFREITILFEKFSNVNQSITVQYKKQDESSFTTLGTVSQSVDGNVSQATFRFADDFITQNLSIRILLTNGGTYAQRPKLRSVIGKFLPVPDYMHEWQITLNCSDRMLLKDGKTEEPKLGEELRNILRTSWWSKEVVSYEDLDGDTVLLNGALTKSATTVPVLQSIDNWPEQGRIRIGDEEILYAGKNRTSFLNCTRGARGSTAAAHSDNDPVTTAYDVIITDYQEQVIVNNRTKDREYKVTLQLLEA